MPYLSKLIKRITLAWSVTALAAIAACTPVDNVTDPGGGEETLVAVLVAPDSADVRVGARYRLVAEARDNRGRSMVGAPVSWTSSDTTVVVVDTSGLVTAVGDGLAEVRAQSRGVSGKAKLRVLAEPVAAVDVNPSSATVTRGQTMTLTARVLSASDSVMADRRVTWTSNAPAVATVDTAGRVSAVTSGSVVITAASEGQSDVAALVVVDQAPATVNNLTVTAFSDTSVTLRFTEVSDGVSGPANYEVRYALPPLAWETATTVARGSCATPMTGTSVGATRTCEVRGLTPGTNYRLIVRAFRGAFGSGAIYGPLSNLVAATTDPAVVTNITLAPATSALVIGQTATFVPTLRDANGNVLTGRTVTWSSTNPAIATVTSGGVATALAAGSTTIRATSGSVVGSAAMTVSAPSPAPVASVTVGPASDTVVTGATVTFVATLRDSTGAALSGRPITWTSTNTAVATVNASGVVTGVAAGTATIRATSEGVVGNASLLVIVPPVASVLVGPASDTVVTGATVTYTATPRDAAGATLTGRSITWSSANTAIATVNASGVVTGVAAGSTTIRATSEGVQGTAAILVTVRPVATVMVGPSVDTVNVGASAPFTVTLRDATGATLTGRTVTWSSTNTAVATVNASGVVTGVAAGTATIRATSETIVGTATMLVVTPPPAPVATVTVGPTSSGAYVGASAQFSVTLRDAAGNALTGRTVTWSSTNTAVATVSASGVATAVAVGTATIRATSEGQTGQATFTVQAAPAPGSNSLYYNSQECSALNPSILFCDDFEDGDWYTKDADQANASGGVLQTDGWYGTIYANPITPSTAAYCGARGANGTSCAATGGTLTGAVGGRNMASHAFAGGPVSELWARWYYRADAGYQWGAEKNVNFTKLAGDITWFNVQFNCGTGSRQPQATPHIQIIHGTNTCQSPNVSPISIQSGRWYYFEVHLRLNSSGTTPDGLIEMWINDCGDTGVCTGTPTLRTRMTNVAFNRNQTGCTTNPCQVEVLWFENWANPGSIGTNYYDQIIASRSGPIGFMP